MQGLVSGILASWQHLRQFLSVDVISLLENLVVANDKEKQKETFASVVDALLSNKKRCCF